MPRAMMGTLVLVALTGVAGCGGSRPAPTVAPVAPARSVLSSNATSLRAKWYRDRAEQELIEQCMARRGFVYTMPAPGPVPGPETITAFALGRGRPATYGITTDMFTDKPPTDPGSDQPRYELALDGPSDAIATMTIAGGGSVSYETGGCQGNAREQLYGSVGSLMASAYLPQVQGRLFSGFLDSYQPYQSALHAWQKCMKAGAFTVTNPDDAANSLQPVASHGSAADLARRQAATAAADTACDGPSHLRQRTNQALDEYAGSLSAPVLAQLDDVARSRARADQLAPRIVSP